MIKYFDLQLFSEEKTEEPTAKKLRDARRKGQVAQSKDFNSAVSLMGVFMVFSLISGYYVTNIKSFLLNTFDLIPGMNPDFYTENEVGQLFSHALQTILVVSLPLLAVALVLGVAVSIAQVGLLLTPEPLQPKFSKLNPLKGLKNMFSSRALVELAKSISKAVLILWIAVSYIMGRLDELTSAVFMEIGQMSSMLWDIIYNVVIRCGILLLIIAVFDYEFKRRKNKKELMMSKYEVKQEYKQSEGDPQLKAKIKEKQRAMTMSRMMSQVPQADVIITNPTHYAIAIKYDADVSSAPIVIAKGQDLVALNIKKIAGEHDIPMVENVELAQAMYFGLEVGDEIPAAMYEAVAEVLAYVYSIKNPA